MKSAKAIRKEKYSLIKKLESEGRKDAYNEAGRLINEKYGKGWQENNNVQSYNDWWQRNNLNGGFAYNGVTDDF